MANSDTKTQPWHSDRIVRIQLGFSLVSDHDGGRSKNGAELASGERLQGAQAGGKFRGG